MQRQRRSRKNTTRIFVYVTQIHNSGRTTDLVRITFTDDPTDPYNFESVGLIDPGRNTT